SDAHAGHARADLGHELLALLTAEKLRITDRPDEPDVRRDEARRGDDRSGERRHADLIDTDDTGQPSFPEDLLEAETRHPSIIGAGRSRDSRSACLAAQRARGSSGRSAPLFAKRGGLPDAFAQEVEGRPPGVAVAHDLDLLETWR